MKSIVCTLLGAYASATATFAEEFEFMKYIAEWNKSYGTREEYEFRLANWLELDAFIKEVNAPDSEYTHTAEHNAFSDWTDEEYGRLLTQRPKGSVSRSEEPLSFQTDLPKGSVDWRTKGCVADIKNQGSCGAQWAFSAIAAMESDHCISGNALNVLSEQQLLDCSADFGTKDCTGGSYYLAWKYAQFFGIALEDDYKWSGKVGNCAYDATKGKVSTEFNNPYLEVYGNSEYMMEAIDEKPAAVQIDSSSKTFKTYKCGVITHGCTYTAANHSMVVAGYNTNIHTFPHVNQPYWLVRNSFGKHWGEQGYVKIGMADGIGVCGINQFMAYPFTQTWTPMK